MVILGIDPGLAIVGWGVIDYSGSKFTTLGYGSIETPAHTDTESRLLLIYQGLSQIINKYRPEQMAVEELFFNTNITTGIRVAEARGVILMCAHQLGKPIPVGRLLWKEPRMLKAHGLDAEGQIPVADRPGFGELVFAPGAAARRGTAVARIRLRPKTVLSRVLPDDLRIGANENILPPSLKPLTVRGIEQLVILPIVSNPHFIFSQKSLLIIILRKP